jgi:hypothetical protein
VTKVAQMHQQNRYCSFDLKVENYFLFFFQASLRVSGCERVQGWQFSGSQEILAGADKKSGKKSFFKWGGFSCFSAG